MPLKTCLYIEKSGEMKDNVSKLLTNFIEITEEKYQASIFVHKIDKEDVKL